MDVAVDIIVDSVLAVDGNGNQCGGGIALGGSNFGCRSKSINVYLEAGVCLMVESVLVVGSNGISEMDGFRCAYHGGLGCGRRWTWKDDAVDILLDQVSLVDGRWRPM